MFRLSVVVLLVIAGCSQEPEPIERSASTASGDSSGPEVPVVIPVTANRGPEVEDGFRGDVHPQLNPDRLLDVTATCSPISRGRGFELGYFPQQFRAAYDAFSVARSEQTYTAHDFSAFLPEKIGQPGQVWEIDLDRVAPFLKQIHSGATLNLAAPGRRSGPSGGFAVLRAVSEIHVEILARVHAEFVLEPDTYLTPAYFECRLIIDRTERRVSSFSMSLPTDIGLNSTLTYLLPTEALIDIVHVDQMELVGGDVSRRTVHDTTLAIPVAEARGKLKESFYKFLEIEWVKPESAVAEARNRNRPILAIVLWGDLDDQSC